ncbi:MAG: aspartate-semialdehyde dehydrogenase [Proteobacteria bacterium]|nr:aspartate-semialdehyde dehydrogenase [Pseudomonadota bacterium]
MGYTVAVVGATGVVGHEMLATLESRNFPCDKVHALASKNSVGREVSFGDTKTLKVQALDDFDFKGVDIVLSSAGAKISADFAPRATKAGAVVIDNTSHFRMDPDVPLVVPEVNPEAIADYKKRGIIANPNCSTIQMVMALKPLHDIARVKRVVVATYQSVSGAGKEAMDELFEQSRKFFVSDAMTHEVFSKQIAFNVIPQIDIFMDDGMTKEEWKMMVETKKIMGGDIKVSATCVRVPTFIGHAEAVNVEFDGEMTPKIARAAWKKFKGVSVIERDSEMEFVTPAEIAGEDDVFISRVRSDQTVENGLSFWCVSDNLRKGAALNAVQIAEVLAKKYL